jgi:hypothetical protein
MGNVTWPQATAIMCLWVVLGTLILAWMAINHRDRDRDRDDH